MSIQEIEKKIIEQAEAEAAGIRDESNGKVEELAKAHSQAVARLKSEIKRQSQRLAEEIKRSQLVPARLAARKALLEEKQKIMGRLYTEIKTAKKLSAAELNKLREESEVAAASTLFK